MVFAGAKSQSTMGREPGCQVAEAEDPPWSGNTVIARALTRSPFSISGVSTTPRPSIVEGGKF
jgi:hypothetical protein